MAKAAPAKAEPVKAAPAVKEAVKAPAKLKHRRLLQKQPPRQRQLPHPRLLKRRQRRKHLPLRLPQKGAGEKGKGSKGFHVFEFNGVKVPAEEIIENVKATYKAEGGTKEIETLEIYVKPEENAAYYVVNGELEGKRWTYTSADWHCFLNVRMKGRLVPSFFICNSVFIASKRKKAMEVL